MPTTTSIHAAIENIEAAIRETRHITDPRNAGCVENIKQRLRHAAHLLAEPSPHDPGHGLSPHVVPDAVENRDASDMYAFLDKMKKLRFIDRQPWMGDTLWRLFRDDPLGTFLRVDGDDARRLWEMVQK